jgi:hypothetical protein
MTAAASSSEAAAAGSMSGKARVAGGCQCQQDGLRTAAAAAARHKVMQFEAEHVQQGASFITLQQAIGVINETTCTAAADAEVLQCQVQQGKTCAAGCQCAANPQQAHQQSLCFVGSQKRCS